MMSNKKVTISSDVHAGDIRVANLVAVIDLDNFHVRLAEHRFDEDAYEQFRDVVRQDRNDFEDFAYSLKDKLKNELTIQQEEVVPA